MTIRALSGPLTREWPKILPLLGSRRFSTTAGTVETEDVISPTPSFQRKTANQNSSFVQTGPSWEFRLTANQVIGIFTAVIGTGLGFVWKEMKDGDAELKKTIEKGQAEQKADLVALEGRLKANVAELKADMKANMAELKADMKANNAELRADMKADNAELRADIKEILSRLPPKR